MNTTPATTKPAGPPATLRDRLESESFKAAVAKALPKHLTPDRFIRVACTTVMRIPKLADCDQTSFFNALLTLSQLGLEPDGRRAHLIPFENRKRNVMEVQLIIDYKGLVELILRSGLVSNLHADVVCENDAFAYDMGQIKMHKINFMEPRGEVYAVYCIARFKDGSEKCDVMTTQEIEAVRSRSRAGQAGPWVTDWNEMSKKTVFRRLSKWLPLSPEFRDAIEADEDVPIGITTTPPFQPEAQPKSKPQLGKKKEVAAAPEPEPQEMPPDEPVEKPPLPPVARTKAAATQSAEPTEPESAPTGGVGLFYCHVTPELKAKLTDMGVSPENFDKWVLASGRAALFSADPKTASEKLLSEERSLKKLQTLYGAE